MTMGPAPMMRIDLMSVRLGMVVALERSPGAGFCRSGASNPETEGQARLIWEEARAGNPLVLRPAGQVSAARYPASPAVYSRRSGRGSGDEVAWAAAEQQCRGSARAIRR